MHMTAELQHLLRVLKTASLLIVAGLFLGALFYIPDPYKQQFRGKVDKLHAMYLDGTALAYVNTQMSLLGVIMSDIRCACVPSECANHEHCWQRLIGITALCNYANLPDVTSSFRSSMWLLAQQHSSAPWLRLVRGRQTRGLGPVPETCSCTYIAHGTHVPCAVFADRLYHFYVAVYWRYISKVRPEDLYRHDQLPDMVSC